jgi:hypothetical protein
MSSPYDFELPRQVWRDEDPRQMSLFEGIEPFPASNAVELLERADDLLLDEGVA